MSLPNLSALDPARRTAPTAEFHEIKKADAEKYWENMKAHGEEYELDDEEIKRGVRKIPDPTTLDPLPFSDPRRTFRVLKDPKHPDRGHNWHDARALAKWVRLQIVERKKPVTDPFKAILSKGDIDALRREFKGDIEIPPYDPKLPPANRHVEWLLASLSQNHSIQPNVACMHISFGRYQELSVVYSLNMRTSPTVGASLLKYFLDPLRRVGPDPAMISELPLIRTNSVPSEQTEKLDKSMRWLQQNYTTNDQVRMAQTELHGLLRDAGAWIMEDALRHTFHGLGHRGDGPAVSFQIGVIDDNIVINWNFSGLTDEFYTAMGRGFRATDGGSSPEIAHTGLLRLLIYRFQELATQIFWSSAMQMAIYPLNPVSEDALQPDSEDGPEELGLSYCYQLEAAPTPKLKPDLPTYLKTSPLRSVINRLRESLGA